MTDGRNELIKFIADERNSPMACLGAAVSYAKVNSGKHGPRICGAIDEAMVREIRAIQAEHGSKNHV